ncbi:MAG: hypothetical protein OEV85_09060 [Candidatus Thorarchaeota archaeon]|nr:hypothetical protein [Candidatus Thorarchaeota archaeon]
MQITDATPVGYYNIISIITETFVVFIIIGTLLIIMNRRSRSFKAVDLKNMRMNITNIVFILLLIAILSPASLNIYPRTGFYPSVTIFAMSWQISDSTPNIFMFGPEFLLIAFLFLFMKFVFIYQLFKYYYHMTTKNRVIIVGIISEFQLTLIGLAIIPLAFGTPSLAVMFSLPIPVLLLTGLLMLKFIPAPPLLGGWEELEKPKEWWDGVKR